MNFGERPAVYFAAFKRNASWQRWYDVTCERGAYDTSDAYTQLQKDLPDVTEWSGGKVYYLTDPDEAHLMTDEWMPRVLREFDMSTILPPIRFCRWICSSTATRRFMFMTDIMTFTIVIHP